MYTMTPTQVRSAVTDCIKTQLVPMIHGSPGIGKSDIIRQIAKEFGLFLVDLRLSQREPTDLTGLPFVDLKNNIASYYPFSTFPLESTPIPTGYNGWLIFLDEFNTCDDAMQAAAYQLTLDRMVGEHKLHKNVAIICAGNLETDGAIVHSLSTANQSRLVHVELAVSQTDWLEWAFKNNIHHHITSYIRFRPDNLHKFDAAHNDRTFACPRTWKMASDLLHLWDADEREYNTKLLGGVISEGVAVEFTSFTKIYTDLPELTEVYNDPLSAPLPTSMSGRYALSGLLSTNITKAVAANTLTYIQRLPKEFQLITVKEIYGRFPEIDDIKGFGDILVDIADAA